MFYDKSIHFYKKKWHFSDANSPDECCFKYYARKIPIAKITSYMETRMDCAKAGIMWVLPLPVLISILISVNRMIDCIKLLKCVICHHKDFRMVIHYIVYVCKISVLSNWFFPSNSLVTQKSLRICVNPELSWVKSAIKMIDDRDF